MNCVTKDQKQKESKPYVSMTSEVSDGKLYLSLEASDIEETIRFAYGLHLSLLPVVHQISVSRKGYGCAACFIVEVPNHGNK